MADRFRSVEVLRAGALTPDHQSRWAHLQLASPLFESPFYTPDLTALIGAVRDDAEVAVMREGGEVVGFFPYLRGRGVARPIAGRLTEYQGPVCRPDVVWGPKDLLRLSGLRAWYFDHLPEIHPRFRAHSWHTVPAPHADLGRGFQPYATELQRRGAAIAQVRRKERKLAREVGPVRFELHSADHRAFAALLAWKTDQYRRMGRLQIFTYPWIVQLLETIKGYCTERFAGVLSVLHAGDHMVAVHLGLRTRRVLHIWFPAYNRQFDRYSPGVVLLLHLAEHASRDGVERIDFGPGEERYKQEFKTGDTRLLVGGVDLRIGGTAPRKGWYSLNEWIRRHPYREYLEIPINATRRYRQWLAFR